VGRTAEAQKERSLAVAIQTKQQADYTKKLTQKTPPPPQ
jgi:hypothetical protein